jgi:hypothetical protein
MNELIDGLLTLNKEHQFSKEERELVSKIIDSLLRLDWIATVDCPPTIKDADKWGHVIVWTEFGCEIKYYQWVKADTYTHWTYLPESPLAR